MLTIIDYGAGNLKSLCNIVDYLGYTYRVTDSALEVSSASKILFPGQGAAASSMTELKKRNLVEAIKNTTVPFLGICVGMQVLFDYSEEGNTPCLGIIPGSVKRFQSSNPSHKIPQIGWNTVKPLGNDPLFTNIPDQSYFYFVHSYACFPQDEKYSLGKTDYTEPYTSVVKKDNFYGVQFHTEKSAETGMQLLKNFIELC